MWPPTPGLVVLARDNLRKPRVLRVLDGLTPRKALHILGTGRRRLDPVIPGGGLSVQFLFERLWHSLIVLFWVSLLVFLLMRLTGDPLAVMLPPEATDQDRALLRRELGLSRKGKKARKDRVGVIEVGCLDVCPKGAVVVIPGRAPDRWLLAPRGMAAEELVEKLKLES